MTTSTTFFVIYNNTSRYGVEGLRPRVMWTFDKTIIEAAAFEMNRRGESLENMAGIEWIEDADGNMTPARNLTYDEVLALSIENLGDDGRMYTTFATDAAGASAFIETAEDNGMGDEARAIVEKFNS
ncbi:MAG: hypothetical protein HKM02_03325 [Pseudomonadales bacterium]|nr:hypothetical protein [Pseudomonadales bacterium]